MDLVAGGVIRGLPSSWERIRSPRTPFFLSSWASRRRVAFAACSSCPLVVCRNASAVVPFAKKKRKGGSEEPPDEEEGDDFVDEMEGEDDDDEEEEDVDDDGMAGKFWLYLFVLFVGIFQYWAEGGRGGGAVWVSAFSLHFFHHSVWNPGCSYGHAF